MFPFSLPKPIIFCNIMRVREDMLGKLAESSGGSLTLLPTLILAIYNLQVLPPSTAHSVKTMPIFFSFSSPLVVCCPLQICTETWSAANLGTDLHIHTQRTNERQRETWLLTVKPVTKTWGPFRIQSLDYQTFTTSFYILSLSQGSPDNCPRLWKQPSLPLI